MSPPCKLTFLYFLAPRYGTGVVSMPIFYGNPMIISFSGRWGNPPSQKLGEMLIVDSNNPQTYSHIKMRDPDYSGAYIGFGHLGDNIVGASCTKTSHTNTTGKDKDILKWNYAAARPELHKELSKILGGTRTAIVSGRFLTCSSKILFQ